MNIVDFKYCDLLLEIIETGVKQGNRTGVAAYKIPPRQIQIDMSKGKFPLLTTKKMAWKTIKVELEGFIKGVTSKKWFQDRGCFIWDEFSFTDERARGYGDESRKLYQLKSDDLGPLYGFQWRDFSGEYIPTPNADIPFFPMEESVDGEVYSSNKYGDFIIINNNEIQFLYNGFRLNARRSNINRGQVKNPYYPIYFGVGCFGIPKNKDFIFYKKAKSLWVNMLSRCYNKDDKDYERYGGKGVTVSNSWLVFEHFLNDFEKIQGYKEFAEDPKNFSLDKDSKQRHKKYKQYSLSGCCFLNKSEQSLNTCNSILFDAISPDGKILKDRENLTGFCNTRGLDHADANKRLNGKNKYKVNGWDFVNKRKVQNFKANECDQLKSIVEALKTNPEDRRMICLAWNPLDNDRMALPPCHYVWQVTTRGDSLDLTWTQRSVDVFLGLPFNIASYALLLHLLCLETGLKPGYLTGNLTDVHLYENHIDQAEEQLERLPYHSPVVNTKNWKSIFDWGHSQTELVDYKHHPAIKAEVAV